MSRTVKAFLLSFLVYLLPILAAHGGSLLGIILWAELVDGGSGREPLWLAMDAGLGLALQLAAFIAFRWMLGGQRLRWLGLAVFVPVLFSAFNLAYQVAIPKRFLIEPETAVEVGDWPVACSVADASVTSLPAGVTLALERAGEVWIRTGQDARYAVLSMPGCRVTPRQLFFPGARGGIGFVAPGGAIFYRLDEQDDGVFDNMFLAPGTSEPVTLAPPPEDENWFPVISANGQALAWIETERGENRRITAYRLAVRRLEDGRETRIELALDIRSGPTLLDFDSKEFLVARNGQEIVRIGADGRIRGQPVRPPDFDYIGKNIRLFDGGWVAWDGYQEGGRYRVAWSAPSGGGRYEIPRGRSITAVSVDPGGRYIALSVSRNLSIGNVRDAVFVLRIADGTEIYRRFLPGYTRSQVAFLGPDYLAVSLTEDGMARIDVLRVPAE